jgi:hypothetical protein
MTRYEKIMQEMTVETMAEIRTDFDSYEDEYRDWCYVSINDAGRFNDHEDAIKAEIEWLNGRDT